MKRKQRMFMSLLLAFVLVLAPTAQVLAESYDVADDLSEEVLYPGDELTGLTEDVTLKVDDEEVSFEDGTWKNESDDIAYSVSQEDGSVELKTEKYRLTVENGTSEGDGFYAEDDKVYVEAQDPEDGSVFAGWTVDMDEDEYVYVEFEDASSASTTLTMPYKAATVKANFEAAPAPETEAPAVEEEPEPEPVPETEAPVVEVEPEPVAETEAPVVEAEPEPVAETEAPVVEVEPEPTPETEAPAEAEPEPTPETEAPAEAEPETEEPVQIMAFHVVTIDYEFDDAYAVPETENYDAGETVEITAEDLTDSGYAFNSWYVESLNVEPDSLTDPTITFVMPDEDVSIAAVYDNLTESDGTDATADVSEPVYLDGEDDGDTGGEDGTNDGSNDGGDSDTNTSNEVYVQVDSDTVADITVCIGDNTEPETEGDNGYACEPGSTVTITVTSSLDNFGRWDVSCGDENFTYEINTNDDGQTVISFTMPSSGVTIKAVGEYTISIVNGEIILDEGNSTEAEYAEGDPVNITIQAQLDDTQVFTEWSVDPDSDTLGIDSESLKDAETALEFTMPDSDVTITAVGEEPETPEPETPEPETETDAPSTETDAEQTETEPKQVATDPKNAGTGSSDTDDSESSDSGIQTLSYTVTVVNGYASQTTYEPGEIVTITSDYPETNKEFSSWTLVSGQTELEDASRATTTFTMPESDVVVSASYQNGPTSYIEGIEEDGIYASEEKLTFTPVGGGMNNTNPNPGDIRYVPTSYTIGNVSNTWSSAPYTTSMSIKKAGEYTLTVCFTKQVWNGGSWADDGTTYLATVTFHIVDPAGSVETGDTTPINLVLTIALAALVIFLVILTVFLVRRRRRSEE